MIRTNGHAIIVALLLAGCGTLSEAQNKPKAPAPVDRAADLRVEMDKALAEAEALRGADGVLVDDDCDAAEWEGKYQAAVCSHDMRAFEDPARPGKFFRAPTGCRSSPNPNWEDWSRDMGSGLLAYAWRCNDLPLLERHIAYGRAHPVPVRGAPAWRMGEPVGDGRSIYTPAFVGRIYQTVKALGGEDNLNRYWPDVYVRGLDGYQSHLQVMNIWHRGEVAVAIREGHLSRPGTIDDAGDAEAHLFAENPPPQTAATLDVSGTMLNRLEEHAARDPRDPLFAAVLGTYTGDMGPAVEACLAPDQYAGAYVRCHSFRKCQLAAWIFACDIVLRRLGL